MGGLIALALLAGAEPMLPKGWTAPQDWQVEEFANGDLNGDGRPDLVVALRNAQDEMELQIYLQQADGSWQLHTTSPGATCYRCGDGAKAPQVEGLPSIDAKGVLRLDYVGGSRESTEDLAKFRLDKTGHFILIGYTHREWDSISEHPERDAGYVLQDANLATLKLVETHGKKKVECRVAKKLKGLELSKYEYGKLELGGCGKRR